MSLVSTKCVELGASDEQAQACGEIIESLFIKKGKEGKKAKIKEAEDIDENSDAKKDNDTLLFLSPKEVEIIATAFQEKGFIPNAVITQKDPKKGLSELTKLIGPVEQSVDALDVALFGRMVAKAAEMNVEAAASFAHAISTHKATNEIEFFTGWDDSSQTTEHMGSLEFNSATYYRVRQLYQDKAQHYQVGWKGRVFTPGKFEFSDITNQILTATNAALYGILCSAVHSMGYSPHIGFIHSGSPLPFVYDLADLYKEELCIDLAFSLTRELAGRYDKHRVAAGFRERVINTDLLSNLATDMTTLLGNVRAHRHRQ